MNRILRKRFPRQIRADFFRLGSLFLMIALCMYIIIALVDAAEVVIRGTENNQIESRLEDGQFTVFNALTDEQISTLTGTGAVIEPHISYDLTLDDGSVIRIFKNRELIDTVVLDCGRYASADDEIVLEKRYCEEHDISVGNVLNIGGRDITVTGIGSSVDYDAPLKKLSDTAVDSTVFGTGFVTPGGYDLLKSIGSAGSEDLTYAFILNGSISADDLKQMIRDLEFDYRSVEDPYYLEMLDDTYGRRDEIRDGISDLADGAEELYDGAGELYDGTGELHDGALELEDGLGQLSEGSEELLSGVRRFEGSVSVIPGVSGKVTSLVNGMSELDDGINEAHEGSVELADGAAELHDGAEKLYEGAGELYDGIGELQEQSDELLDEIFTGSPDNLTSFILKEDNLRIGGAAGDIEINKTIGLVDGIVVIILFAYVLSVFVINQIREESST
ncbi:MAG: ABC transporter permease, partial [Lachnospiraceae bacterium]|nr:ABC transporter permease [Lachnospiraceae bacterium]